MFRPQLNPTQRDLATLFLSEFPWASKKLSRELRKKIWENKVKLRKPGEALQTLFFQDYYKAHYALVKKAFLRQFGGSPAEHLVVEEIIRTLSPTLDKSKEQLGELLIPMMKETANVLIPLASARMARTIGAVQYIWEKHSKKASPPPTLSKYDLNTYVHDDLARNYYQTHKTLLEEKVSHTELTELNRVLSNGVAQGLGPKDLAVEIGKLGDVDRSGWRAERVARTEINSMMNRINLDEMKGAGLIETKQWLSMADERVRHTHGDADGQLVPLNGKFIVGGSEMDCPGDPAGDADEIVNCRCDMLEGIDPKYLPENVDDEELQAGILEYLTQVEEEILEGAAEVAEYEKWDGPDIKTEHYQAEVTKHNVGSRYRGWTGYMHVDNYTDLKAYMKEVDSIVQRQLKDAKVAIRVNQDVFFNTVVPSGRFKTQFETGSSGGLFNQEYRAKIENRFFGYKAGLAAEKRPVYGFLLDESPQYRDVYGAVQWYGNLTVVLKDEVRSRTTWCGADSLSTILEKGKQNYFHPATAPTKLTEYNSAAVYPGRLAYLREGLAGSSNQYAEAQVHGGVKVSDIAEVIFSGDQKIPSKWKNTLTKLKIKWRHDAQ